MKVLLLLAGRSKRFWPLKEKSFFPLCGMSPAEIIVTRLREAGHDDITLVGNEENVDRAAEQFPGYDAVRQQDVSLGMRGALLDALPAIGDAPVLIVSGNDVVDVAAYRDTAALLNDAQTDGALLAKKMERYFPGGYLTVDADGRIRDIVEKPGAGKEPSELVNIVVHAHRSAATLLDALHQHDSDRDDGYERALASLFGSYSYRSVPYDGFWQPVKYPWHMLQLLPHLLAGLTESRIHPTAEVHPSAVLSGHVFLDEDVRILPHATIVGPCTIGKGSIVGNNALVRGSSVGEHCVIGYNTEVKGSVLADHVWTHSTYIGDSIIGSNVSFGAGSVTGNLRLDEGEILSAVNGERIPTGLSKFGTAVGDDCRIGIRCAINPGIKIGAGSFLSSGVLPDRDIPDGSFVSMKDGMLQIKDNTTQAPRPEERMRYRATL